MVENINRKPDNKVTPKTTLQSAADLGALADERFNEGRLNEAIRAYRRAIASEPDSAWYHHGLAEVLARKGFFVMARVLYRRALELNPAEVKRWHQERTPHYQTETPIEAPVFVLGCPHSGTTIMTRLIGNHPNIMHAEMRETDVFTRAPDVVDQTLTRWDRACAEAGRGRWVEKSVIHTFMLPKLRAARPSARFIVVVRDGRDAIASMKTRKYAFSGLDDLIHSWTLANEVLSDFAEQFAAPIVRYEDLILEPELTLRRVCEAVEEDYVAEMLQYSGDRIEWNLE